MNQIKRTAKSILRGIFEERKIAAELKYE